MCAAFFHFKHGCRTAEPFEPCRGLSTKRAMTQTRGLRANGEGRQRGFLAESLTLPGLDT